MRKEIVSYSGRKPKSPVRRKIRFVAVISANFKAKRQWIKQYLQTSDNCGLAIWYSVVKSISKQTSPCLLENMDI
jgi:hypothetical protein